jgi:hypothetical protein
LYYQLVVVRCAAAADAALLVRRILVPIAASRCWKTVCPSGEQSPIPWPHQTTTESYHDDDISQLHSDCGDERRRGRGNGSCDFCTESRGARVWASSLVLIGQDFGGNAKLCGLFSPAHNEHTYRTSLLQYKSKNNRQSQFESTKTIKKMALMMACTGMYVVTMMQPFACLLATNIMMVKPSTGMAVRHWPKNGERIKWEIKTKHNR